MSETDTPRKKNLLEDYQPFKSANWSSECEHIERDKNINQSDTPRTSKIWGGLLCAYPHLENSVNETALMEKELAAARAEADKWRESYEVTSCSAKTYTDQLEKDLKELTDQRDRLAEALEQCREDSVELLGERDWWQHEPRCDYKKRYQETRDNVTRADKALQSLTTNTPDQERKSPASDCSI